MQINKKSNLPINHQISLDQNHLHIFMDILRNKLYSNPLQAMCREILSNARDSHVEAGIPDKPIYVQLPNDIRNILVIEDFGVGMSPEQIKSVYAKILNSTKRDSNNQIKRFGIGSKTPLVYTDSFNVISVYNGIKNSYVVYIDESKVGAISLLNTEPTDQHNGVRIEVVINRGDLKSTKHYIEHIVQYWKVKPTGLNLDSVKDRDSVSIYENDNVSVYSTGDYYGENLAVIDEIPFKIETNKMDTPINTSYLFYFIIYFKANELSVTTNKESLKYNLSTQKELHKRISLHQQELAIHLYNQIFNNEENDIIKAYSLWRKYAKYLRDYAPLYKNNYSSEVYKYKDFIDFNDILYNNHTFTFNTEDLVVLNYGTKGKRIRKDELLNKQSIDLKIYPETTIFLNDLNITKFNKNVTTKMLPFIDTYYYTILNPLNEVSKDYNTLMQKYSFLKYFKIIKLSSIYTPPVKNKKKS